MTTATTEVRTVRLGDLAPDPVAIAGREDRLGKIDDLKASIPALGQRQSLRVRPWVGGDYKGRTPLYGVTEGNRRLATFEALLDAGGAIRGEAVTLDTPIFVVLSDEDDATAFQGTVAENVQRLPETVVGEFRAFARMAETKAPREIAATFGISEKRVQQRLKLAALHPDVIAALESGRIKLDAAEAFTLAEPDRQAKYLKGAADWQLHAHSIRSKFTEKLVSGASPVARIIGAEAYQKAGGKVLGDPFSDSGYWISTELIDRLLEAHWERESAKWTAEGWGFVEEAEAFCKTGNAGYTLKHDHEHLRPEGGSRKAPECTAAQKAGSGVVYFAAGDEAPHFGVMRAKKKKQTAAKVETPDLDKPPHEVRRMLDRMVGESIGRCVVADPALALKLVIATLVDPDNVSPLGIARHFDVPEHQGKKPMTFNDKLAKVKGMTLTQLAEELAKLIAPGFWMPDEGEVGPLFFELVKPRLVFDAKAYFGAVTKPFVLECLKDMTDPEAGEKAPRGSAEEVVAKAIKRAKDTGWLPPQLRRATYGGPHFLTPDEPLKQAAE